MDASRTFRTTAALLVALLVAPTIASACTIDFRTVGPVAVTRAEVRRPLEVRSTRGAWKVDRSWVSTSPELNQELVSRTGARFESVTFAGQRALAIDAAAPSHNSFTYVDDAIDHTPPCQMVGKSEWQEPVVLVREERTRVRIAAVAKRTAGNRTGCAMGSAEAVRGCPTLTRSIIQLARPVGARRLVFETFA